MSYMVMERGTFVLPGSSRVEAGTFNSDKFQVERIRFGQIFKQTPIVIVSISSCREADAVVPRIQNVGVNGFDFCMREQELNDPTHISETISYIAWEPSKGEIGSLAFEVKKIDNTVSGNSWHAIAFDETFVDSPMFFASMQTTYGGDTANLRWRNKTKSGIDIKISEEQSADDETGHTIEAVGYIAIR